MLLLERFEPFFEIRSQCISYPHSVAAGFVHIGGPDSLEGGADLGSSFRCLRCRIYDPVGGQDQMGFFGDHYPLPYRNAHGFDFHAFFPEDDRIDYHSVADDINGVFSEYSRRDRMQNEFFAFEMKGMPGIGASLETGDDRI